MSCILAKCQLLWPLAFALAASACSEGIPVNDRSADRTAASCLPPESALVSASRDKEFSPASELNVFIDGSQSMAGFNAGVTGDLRPLGDLLAIIGGRGSEAQRANYFAFGKSIRPISSESAQRYGTSNPFNCVNCDNQESRLDAVLQKVASADPQSLSLIVTDLWLDNKAFAGSPQVALGQPLRAALQQDRAIGVIGISAPFKGAVYDVPGVGTYRGATSLPLYVIAVGREGDVAAFHEALEQSGGPSFRPDRMNFSLFSAAPHSSLVAGQLKAVGAGVSQQPSIGVDPISGVAQYLLEQGLADGQGGRLGRTFNAAQLGKGRVWQGVQAERTNVWRVVDRDALRSCSKGAWQALSPIEGIWKARGSDGSATFSFGGEIAKRLRPGNVYYLETRYGSNSLAVPNPANRWLREWSLEEANASALVEEGGPFKTLNLGDLTTILEKELARQLGDGREVIKFGFLLKVDR